MRHPDFASSNRRAILLMIIGLVLALILMSLPLYSFNISVYTKKSPNTFVGDEKYLAVRAEVEETAQKYREQGFDVEIGEDVVERVNSKGQKTSLITFTINESFGKSMLGFLRSGLPSVKVATAILLLMAFALIAALLGCRGSMDLSEKDGGLPPDSVVQTIDGIMRDCEDAVRKYHDGAAYSMHRVALAPCSPFSVSKTLLSESARLARRLGVRLHTHLAETRDEERYMLEKAGVRPLEYMAQLGWVGEDVWYAHGIWFNDGELALLAETGTGVAHCPVSNMKLSSGVARVPEMVARGIPVGLAVDGSASNDGSNLLEEMRACYLLHRLNSGSKALSGYDVLKLATRGGARLLGRNDIGWIGEGSAADFFLVDLNRPELVGAQFDPAGMLATVGLKGPVDYTVVNGKTVVEKGRLTGVDEKQLSQRANAVCRRYLAR